jgi:Transposase DDE domain
VDGEAQIIVAAAVTQQSNDKQQLLPMVEQVEQNLGAKPQAVSADNGYWNAKQMGDARVQDIALHIATGKQKHGETSESPDHDSPGSAAEASLLELMKQKLKTEAGRDLYRMRKAIVEPVFGQIKEWRGFRRFLLRGFQKVQAEWKLICLTHNLLKLFRSGRTFQMS